MNLLNEKEIVAVDLETTGLEPSFDAIIEIAALRVVNGEITERFITLVNPGRPIPLPIQRITGITEAMIKDAPSEKEALERLLEFVRNSPILGHNVDFDIGFINARSSAYGLSAWSGRRFDTSAIAQTIFPRLLNHQLETLCTAFHIEHKLAHRAESDAEATYRLAEKIWQKLLSFDKRTFSTIYNIVISSGDMGLISWLSSAEKSGICGKIEPPKIKREKTAVFDNILGRPADPTKCTMSENDVIGFLGRNSPLKKNLNEYCPRDIQIKMAQAVHDALEYDMLLVVEAGTGTGKSFAYLLPSIVFASKHGEKVVISTKTKNLQEQLFFKDVPVLLKTLPFEFRATLLKGRNNYLCHNRLSRLLDDFSMLRFDDRAMLARLVVWSGETSSGDISEVGSFIVNRYGQLWSRLCSEASTCIGNRCKFRESCFVQKVRSASVDAQVVVVNHSLLFAEMADSVILGDYGCVVIDEAHDLEEVAAEYFGASVTVWDFTGPLEELYEETLQPRGFLPELFENIMRIGEPAGSFINEFQICIDLISKGVELVEKVFTDLSNRLHLVYKWRESDYPIKQRFHFGEEVFEFIKNDLLKISRKALEIRDHIGMLLESVQENDDERIDTIKHEIFGRMERLSESANALEYMCDPSDPDAVYWWESPTRKDGIDTAIRWAPLDIAVRMNEVFYSVKKSVVFTSATLSVGGDFTYIKNRLGIDLVDEERVMCLELGSPYDFQTQLLALFPDFIPDPKERGFSKAISEILLKISSETRTGTLVLFTNYRTLDDVYRTVYSPLSNEGILVLAQGISGGRSHVTRQFIEDRESVLLGTESFWQGVDVRGDALQTLILTKLPFAVPTEPYIAGQCERIERNGGNYFQDYYVPNAVIKYRQGIGRLIRSETDVGVLVVCDKRFMNRNYGWMFIDSTPVEVERVSSIDRLIEKIKKFL